VITSCQNLDVNFESLPETIDLGTPCIFCCCCRIGCDELCAFRQAVHDNHNGIFPSCCSR
ncbi:hypothetical protein PHMEG_00033795, partial [Phytophthora megakarya]